MLKKYLTIFFISMVPILELRGAIPYSVGFGLPFIYWFARRVLEWGKDKRFIGRFFTWCLVKGERGGQKLMEKSGVGVYIALLLFVGIPLPGTGAWTGTLAASFLELDWRKSVIMVMLGVVMAGVIMYLGSVGVFGAIGLLK